MRVFQFTYYNLTTYRRVIDAIQHYEASNVGLLLYCEAAFQEQTIVALHSAHPRKASMALLVARRDRRLSQAQLDA